jgi:hypothetical protein
LTTFKTFAKIATWKHPIRGKSLGNVPNVEVHIERPTPNKLTGARLVAIS